MVTTKLTKSNIKKIASTAEGDILSAFSMIRPLKKKKKIRAWARTVPCLN
jgi:hypothetical protein